MLALARAIANRDRRRETRRSASMSSETGATRRHRFSTLASLITTSRIGAHQPVNSVSNHVAGIGNSAIPRRRQAVTGVGGGHNLYGRNCTAASVIEAHKARIFRIIQYNFVCAACAEANLAVTICA